MDYFGAFVLFEVEQVFVKSDDGCCFGFDGALQNFVIVRIADYGKSAGRMYDSSDGLNVASKINALERWLSQLVLQFSL